MRTLSIHIIMALYGSRTFYKHGSPGPIRISASTSCRSDLCEQFATHVERDILYGYSIDSEKESLFGN